MADVPVNLPTGRVVGRFIVEVQDNNDPGEEPQLVPATGEVLIKSSIDHLQIFDPILGDFITFRGPHKGVIDADGFLSTPLTDSNEPNYTGMTLWSNDSSKMSVKGWTYTATFNLKTLGGRDLNLPAVTFELATGQILDLAKVTRVPASPGYGLPQAEGAALRAEAFSAASAESAAKAIGFADTTDQFVASLALNPSSETTKAIGLITEPLVEDIATDFLASNAAVVEAAKAAIDANPKISEIEARLPYRGELPDGTDFDTIRIPGIYGVRAQATALTMINIPVPYAGMLYVEKPRPANVSQIYIGSGTGGYPSKHTRITRSDTSWTGPWASDRSMQGFVPVGTDLGIFQSDGNWIITETISASLVDLPPSLTAPFYATLSVVAEVRAISVGGSQVMRVHMPDGSYRVFERVGPQSRYPSWVETSIKPKMLDSGLANDVLVQDWSRRMGGRRKVTTATLAFRFDHGLANFDSKIRAELESRGFKYSLALCSGQWNRTENLGVTPEMVDSWVVSGFAEIWNHSKDHGSGDNSEAQWKAAILDGLSELRSQIPSAQIDGFAVPGSSGTDFGGFTTAGTIEQFYATDGGKLILSNHAVAAGYIGAGSRWQDGVVRQGLGHYTLDSITLQNVQTYTQSAINDKRAVQFMSHPSRLDTVGYMTTSEFVSILDYVQSEVAAGRLEVVSPYEQLLTDVVS